MEGASPQTPNWESTTPPGPHPFWGLGNFVLETPTLHLLLRHPVGLPTPSPSSVAALSGNESLCFTLRLRFSNDVCSAPDSWKTRNSDKNLVPICLYCLKCTEFGQLVLAKIIKIVATRCQILRLKCIKFDVGWGSAPTPLGELTALLRPPSWI